MGDLKLKLNAYEARVVILALETVQHDQGDEIRAKLVKQFKRQAPEYTRGV